MLSHCVRRFLVSALMLAGVLAISILTIAQVSNTKPVALFTATTANVGSSGEAVRVELFAWSTDADRDEFVKAWASPVQPVQPAVVTDAGVGGGGRGGRGGNRGGAAPAAAADGARGDAAAAGAAAAADTPVAAAPARGGRGGRGGARGGRGGRGGDAPPLPAIPVTPTSSLTAALQKAPSVGMLWTSETVGYSIRYAYRLPQSDGTERIILATDRRLGAWNDFWKLSGTVTPSDYPFSVIELRLNAAGLGEGKASLASSITVDSDAKSLALENYANLPVILKAVKRQSLK
jgi:hypothetical protein